MDLKVGVIATFMGVLVLTTASPPFTTKQYRDYEYNKRTDAFYKLHIEAETYMNAQMRCNLEGGSIMMPTNEQDLEQLHGMLKKFPDIGNFVYVGDDGQQHTSAEETPIIDLGDVAPPERRWVKSCEVVSRDMEVEEADCYHAYPYICKVAAKDAFYDERCGVYGNEYKYFEAVHSCYSVPKIAFTWSAAYSECRVQGAHLAVLNSELESQTVQQYLKTVPQIPRAETSYFFFAGIRANQPQDPEKRVWTTIFNETLQAAGFDKWSDGEPNNYHSSEYCGTIFSNNGKYNDVDCTHLFGFLCEKEVS